MERFVEDKEGESKTVKGQSGRKGRVAKDKEGGSERL